MISTKWYFLDKDLKEWISTKWYLLDEGLKEWMKCHDIYQMIFIRWRLKGMNSVMISTERYLLDQVIKGMNEMSWYLPNDIY